MDELIELIVRGLIELFSSRSGASQQPKIVPKVPPRPPSPGQRTRPAPMQRQQTILQQMMRNAPTPKKSKKIADPPPLSRVQTAVAKPIVAPPAAPPPAARPPISATAISQLIRSRPAALRTVYVLSEVIQPPLALRDSSASPNGILGGWPG